MRWAGRVASMGKNIGVYRVFVGRPEGDGSQDSKLPLHASHVALPT